MNDETTDELPPAPNVEAAPANQPLHLVPTAVVPAGEQEVAAMLAEQTRFNDEPEMKAVATRLLEAGYTVQETARRLGLRSSTVWSWSKEPAITQAIAAGSERRRSVLGQGLEQAAEQALGTLLEVANDVGAQPKDRVKASEAILDRCGIVPAKEIANAAVGITVDVDFDERLARIVAGSAVKNET
jgi:transposase-like protein